MSARRPRRRPAATAAVLGGLLAFAASLLGPAAGAPAPTRADDDTDRIVTEAIAAATRLILEKQEDDGAWTYRGVYGVPIGYRVGGTSIVGLALLAVGDRVDRPAAERALERALELVLASLDDPLMDGSFADTYDVRVWGQTYGLLFLCEVLEREVRWARPHRGRIEAAIGFLTRALVATEIPERGGWNYSRPRGGDQPNEHGAFVTAPVVQALLAARAHGASVPDAVLERAGDALERSRVKQTGAFTYSGPARGRGGRADRVPGAIARMPIAETTLILLGRGDRARLAASLDAFFEHWGELEKVRKKQGTHQGPYAIAPYYFFYGQLYAAQAIELLEPAKRPALRRRLAELLLGIREDDGGWNDRVFEVSKSYGSAMAILALTAKDLPPPARLERATSPRPRSGRRIY